MSEIERQRDRAVTSTQWLVGMIVLVLANAAVVWAMVATTNPHR